MPKTSELIGCESCRNVVVRAYRELRSHGVEEDSAFRSALRVLVLRHPERTQEDFAAVAAAWIFGKPKP
jgi:hypothetical protein